MSFFCWGNGIVRAHETETKGNDIKQRLSENCAEQTCFPAVAVYKKLYSSRINVSTHSEAFVLAIVNKTKTHSELMHGTYLLPVSAGPRALPLVSFENTFRWRS